MLAGGANRVSNRLSAVVHESQDYSQNGDTTSSSGWRLNAWRRSLQAIAARPWTGYGVGSWAPAVKRLDGEKAVANFGAGNSSNPHQEYLLWGVELGVLGSLLLIALLLAMVLDARNYPIGIRRATHSAIAVMAIACLFNSSLYDALIGDYLCTTIGLLMAWGAQRTTDRTSALA
jgi:O-antigen ligase